MARKRWIRNAKIGGAIVLAVLVLAFVALWLTLPRIVEHVARKAAADFGLDVASLRIERANFSGLGASDIHVSDGGLDVKLARLEAGYNLRILLGGRVNTLTVDGLVLTLDFTRPRRALLPDAIDDLFAKVPHSDEPLVWPVGKLELKNCAVALVLPEGTETFSISGTAEKGADGRVTFALDSTHPQQQLHLGGAVRTETLEGAIDVQRTSLSPEFLLSLAHRLGVFDLPAGNTLDSTPLAVEGRVTLRAGALEGYAFDIQSGKIAYGLAAVDLLLDSPKLSVTGGVDKKLSAHLTGALTAAGKSTPWRAESAPVDLVLEDGTVRGQAATFSFSWADQLRSRLSLRIDYGIPALGGARSMKLVASIDELTSGSVSLAPTTLGIEGWTDHLAIATPQLEVLVGGDELGAVKNFSAIVTDPFGDARGVKISTAVTADPGLRKFVPAAWTLREPRLPSDALHLDASVAWSEAGPAGTVKIISSVPHADVAAIDGKTFSCTPSLDLTATLDPAGVAATGTIGLNDIKTDVAKFPPGVQAVSFGVEIPHVSFAALGELAGGRVPKDEVGMKLKGSVSRGDARGDSYLEIQHFGAAAEWTAEAWAMLDNLNGAWAGANVNGTRVELTVNTGRTPDARVGEWLRAPDPVAIVREVLPRAKLDLSVTASSLDFPGKTRAEWSGFWIRKPPAAGAGATLNATINAYSGVLHTGPETIEQPAIEIALSGNEEALDVSAKLHALLEGSPVDVEAQQKVAVDWSKLSASGAGPFTVHPVSLKNSDIVSRWYAGAKGIVIGATAQATGTLTWNTAGAWDGTATISLSDGLFDFPDQTLRAEGINTTIALTSLKNMSTLGGQPLQFARLVLGDVEMTNGAFRFSTEGANHVQVDGATAHIFGGDVAVGSFLLIFPAPDVGVVLEFEGIDAGELARQLKIFKGTLTGKLRGKLPLGLLAGKPILGEGYLELDPRVPASFSMDASGLLTTDLPDKTLEDQMVRQPYELAEEALGDLTIKTLHVDLFRRETPDTPIRLEFSGTSLTQPAHRRVGLLAISRDSIQVPVTIVANVKGSISQALDFLLRLATL